MTTTPYPRRNFASNPKPDAKSISQRLGTFIGGRHSDYNLSSVLYDDTREGSKHIAMELWSAPGRSKPSFDEAKRKLEKGEGRRVEPGIEFGPSWTNHWMKMTLTIPSEWKSKDSVELNFDPSCEAMIFNEDGVPLQGITGAFDYNRRVEYVIPPKEVESGKCVRYIEVSANGVFGVDQDSSRDDKYYKLLTVDIRAVNEQARLLKWDFESLRQLSVVLPEKSPLANRSRRVANEIINAFDHTAASVEKGRVIAQDVLGAGEKVEVARDKVSDKGTLWALGYCHIDTAWLWPWSATQQKIARSWSSQLDLMDRYPEYRFMATSAQHFKWLEELYPKLFERVKEKIKTGQFDISGGTWVEMDGNMASGESLCRQFLYGQKYFKSRFDKHCNVLVLPDTFGFNPQLPQIARLGGCSSFFTHKLNWNKVNEFPLTTFNWVGLDGTQVLSHITPIGRYDSDCSIGEIDRAYKNHKNIDSSAASLILYGYGDGGGGPSQTMMERLRRARSAGLHRDSSGEELPLVKTGITLSDFFEHIRKETDNGSKVPDWNGELYLEAHRGVQTSQANTKKNFRKSEILLREVELLSTIASIQRGYAYPKERIDNLWEPLCLCMFHDTLPGSSIRLAVEDYDATFRRIQETGKELFDSALRALESPDKSSSPVVLNTLPGTARQEVVTLPNGRLCVGDVSPASFCGTATSYTSDSQVKVTSDENGFVISNSTLSIGITHGRISSIYDSELKRELLAKGSTAGFVLYKDDTYDGDAWEIEQYSLDVSTPLKFETWNVIESSSLRATIECRLKFGQSQASVKISLDALPASLQSNARSLIRFDCSIDWHERHRLLKFVLPTNLWSSEATYDTAFGVLTRPTHRNTSWDAARFEVPAHKFADYSEHGYGVALINDCKYGYATQGNVMSLSLLRAPTQPDPECDQGHHDFAFAIYPHLGKYAESDVQAVAHAFNNPLKVLERPLVPEWNEVPFQIEGASKVMLESIKRGESDFDARSFIEGKKKTVILRIHEHMGGHASIKLVCRGLQIIKATLVNVLEEEVEDLDVVTEVEKDTVDLEFRAFEIKTVKLEL